MRNFFNAGGWMAGLVLLVLAASGLGPAGSPESIQHRLAALALEHSRASAEPADAAERTSEPLVQPPAQQRLDLENSRYRQSKVPAGTTKAQARPAPEGGQAAQAPVPPAASIADERHDLDAIRRKYESVTVVATGYYAGRESTGKDPGHPQYGITYSGVEVRRDPDAISTIAADLNVFPLGTVLYIPDYGYGIVTDTGSAIRGNKIDLYFHTKEDVYKQWGKKTLDVYIIRKGNGHVTEEMLLDLSKAFKS